jgi:NADP-dependent 3-hydroxy acid dehydrogenase YdfG
MVTGAGTAAGAATALLCLLAGTQLFVAERRLRRSASRRYGAGTAPNH